jgi:beta-xylosidase
MNNGKMVVAADTIALKKGVRDPHVLRGKDGWFYMVNTDMRCAEGWASNRGIVLMRSKDLVNWQHATVHFPEKYKGTNFANVTRVWAPEVIWDSKAKKYLVYFSLLTNDGTIPYDKVFYCYANKDFTDLEGEPVYFYDRGSATIDMDIVYNKKDKLYHAFYKNEGEGGICKVTAKSLTPAAGQPNGSQWSKPSGKLQQTKVAVEGAGVWPLINAKGNCKNPEKWILMYDCYGSGYYQFCETTDLSNFKLLHQTETKGMFTPRHGTVLPVTEKEVKRIEEALKKK